jgi:hypothetical protein
MKLIAWTQFRLYVRLRRRVRNGDIWEGLLKLIAKYVTYFVASLGSLTFKLGRLYVSIFRLLQ